MTVEHRHVGAAEGDAARRRSRSAGPAAISSSDVDDQPDQRRREVAARHLGAARRSPAAPPTGRTAPSRARPTGSPVGLEVAGVRGEHADDVAALEREPGNDPAGDQHVVGGDQRVQPRRLRVVADRVGQRRPRVLEGGDDEGDRAGDLDRDRVAAGGGRRPGCGRCTGGRARSARRRRPLPAPSAGRSGTACGSSRSGGWCADRCRSSRRRRCHQSPNSTSVLVP